AFIVEQRRLPACEGQPSSRIRVYPVATPPRPTRSWPATPWRRPGDAMWEWLHSDAAPADLTPPPDAPELRAFLAAVRDDPDDPAPQLLLADWLDEHGDACARRCSELLRLHAALADAPAERFQSLHDRYAELREAHL